MKNYSSAAILGMLFLSPATFAQDFYMGLGLGSASYSVSYSDNFPYLDYDAASIHTGLYEYSVDDSDTGFNIYGGFKKQ